MHEIYYYYSHGVAVLSDPMCLMWLAGLAPPCIAIDHGGGSCLKGMKDVQAMLIDVSHEILGVKAHF